MVKKAVNKMEQQNAQLFVNKYANYCTICGKWVGESLGYCRKNKTKWEIYCKSCKKVLEIKEEDWIAE